MLSNQQIHYIENRLIKEGVKYWDIRIELLDHVVSEVEKDLNSSDDFEKKVQQSFVNFGWTKVYKFKKTIKIQSTLLNKKYRKTFFKEVVNFFKELKNVIFYLFFICTYLYAFFQFNNTVFYKVSFAILAATFAIPTYQVIKNKSKIYRKSLYYTIGSHYLMLVFFLFNLISPFISKEGFFNLSIQTKEAIIFFFISLHILFVYAGYKTLQSSKKEVLKMYNNLQQL